MSVQAAKPSNLLLKLSRRLYADAPEYDRFVAALHHPQPFHPCILWCHPPEANPFHPEPPLSWQPSFVDRLAIGTRPGAHPLHHQGYFYCLDFSSVFAASVLLAISSPVRQVHQEAKVSSRGDRCAPASCSATKSLANALGH